jgi:hypothetical protein
VRLCKEVEREGERRGGVEGRGYEGRRERRRKEEKERQLFSDTGSKVSVMDSIYFYHSPYCLFIILANTL